MTHPWIAVIVILSLAQALRGQPAPDDAPATLAGASFLTIPGEQWKLAWHDEFNGSTLDQNKWNIGLPWPGTDGEGRQHNPQYASYIMDHDVQVEDGVLTLQTRREDVIDKRGRTFHFTEGLITTAKTFRKQYGYFEARIKIPVDAGPGMWPAFWTLSDSWPPEMDICEVWTSSPRSHQGFCYRLPGQSREKWDDYVQRGPLPQGWTTYGMEWGPGYQIYNINGKPTWRLYGDHVTDEKQYILLNSGIESKSPPTTQTSFPNAFQVDYVRVYDRPDVPVLHNGGFEETDSRPWKLSGEAHVVTDGAKSGQRALRIEAGAAGEQKVYGLSPNSTYLLSGYAKVISDSGEARLGVTQSGTDESFITTDHHDYQHMQLTFATGPNATTAIIRCAVPEKSASAEFDDITIEKHPTGAPR